ncbi:MAG: citrate (Si)-synthase, partial [Chlamydiia bacterium]|nr:citrate (Si)-synthase [Chlamydiia bacterium]
GYCTTSFVDPLKGLFYRGRPISELYQWEPERALFLLLNGKEGGAGEIAQFEEELKKRAHCSKAVIKHIESLPRQGHPMKLFCSALLILGAIEGKKDYREDCLNLMAKLPHLAATVINYHAGWGETPAPKSELGYMENFSSMLSVPDADPTVLGEVFRLFNILHYDHGGGNLSTFTGKAIASGLEDLYGSIAGAMCALAGPRHGRANQDSLSFVQSVLDEVGENGSPADVEAVIRKKLESHQLIFGFGHAVLRVEDVRATIFYEYAQKHFPNHPLVKIALLLRTEGVKVLKENPKISNPYPNIDAMSGSILTAAGFPYPEYYTVLFGLARSVGVSIQILYERLEARGGKGTPIVRPRYLYKSNSG